LDAFCAVSEFDMSCLGCTGTEDKLHPNTSDMMTVLQDAGIFTLVCTGDIKLTAKNVGINAGVLPRQEEAIFDIQQNRSSELTVQLGG
jgi:P-type E1-E2 ATPase